MESLGMSGILTLDRTVYGIKIISEIDKKNCTNEKLIEYERTFRIKSLFQL